MYDLAFTRSCPNNPPCWSSCYPHSIALDVFCKFDPLLPLPKLLFLGPLQLVRLVDIYSCLTWKARRVTNFPYLLLNK
jgi:hypothetical protein